MRGSPRPKHTNKKWRQNNYYPFGLKHKGYNEVVNSNRSEATEKYKFGGKELNDELGLDLYDFGARNYDASIGRWHSMDNLSELYFSNSSYVYALNTPIQAVDPDGNLVIFINGQHTGDGARGYQNGKNWRGSNSYWRNFDSSKSNWISQPNKIAFDAQMMSHLNDYNAIYRDGSMGGFSNTLTGGGNIILGGLGTLFGKSNLNASNRINGGYNQGIKDAKQIIANLERDSQGNIIESIKIISHSMGGAYAKGYAKALLDYAKENKVKGVVIAFEADFAPFQPDEQKAVNATNMGNTLQFSHSKDMVAGNKPMEGAVIQNTSSDKNQGHSIFDFLDQIKNVPSGSYEINGIKITVK